MVDRWSVQYVMLAEPIATSAVVLEFRATFPAGATALSVAEVEVLGTDGDRRAPLALDARRLVVATHGAVWRHPRDTDASYDAARSWLDEIDGKGAARRVMHGSHVVVGSRFAFVGAVRGATCPGAYLSYEGGYYLHDRVNRVVYRPKSPSSYSGWILSAHKGVGFAASAYDLAADAYKATVVNVDGDRVSARIVSQPDHGAIAEALRKRGFAAPKHRPAARWQSGGGTDCTRVKGRSTLTAARRAFGKLAQRETPSPWTRCTTARGFTVFINSETCAEDGFVVLVVDRGGKPIDRRSGTGYSRASPRVLADGTLLLAIERKDPDESDIHGLDASGKIIKLYENSVFAPATPSDCRCSA